MTDTTDDRPVRVVLGVYRRDFDVLEGPVADRAQADRRRALEQTLEGSELRVIDWGDTADERPHEWVQVVVELVTAVDPRGFIDAIVEPGVKLFAEEYAKGFAGAAAAGTVRPSSASREGSLAAPRKARSTTSTSRSAETLSLPSIRPSTSSALRSRSAHATASRSRLPTVTNSPRLTSPKPRPSPRRPSGAEGQRAPVCLQSLPVRGLGNSRGLPSPAIAHRAEQ